MGRSLWNDSVKMQRDIRDTEMYREVRTIYEAIWQPGTGQISDVIDICSSPNGKHAVFTGVFVDSLEGPSSTRICQIDLGSGDVRVLTFGPNADRLPKYSPSGRVVAFLSDRHRTGDFQLYLLDLNTGAARRAPSVGGWIEYLHWSPDGTRILLGVAGHGADIAGTHGAVASKLIENVPSWMPAVEDGHETYRWRRAWIYEVASNSVHQISEPNVNVWEAAWCGNEHLAAVVSSGPREGHWYSARLHVIATQTGASRQVYAPKDQLGWPAASPSGRHLAVVEAVCSDRWLVAGDLHLIEVSSGGIRKVETRGVNITSVEWRSDRHLLLAGIRGLETVVGFYDVARDTFTELWGSHHTSAVGPSVSGLNDAGDCVLVAESFVRAPEVAAVRDGKYQTVRSFDLGYAEKAKTIESAEPVTWTAPDGLEIQGWFLQSQAKGPCPVVMNLHGGPVWSWRPAWLGRPRSTPFLMLIKAGCSIFLPNPRGSSGRGRDFARRVIGDLGGADSYDCLSGLDHLIDRNLADPKRLGVIGISYGGFMTAWLITQDSRFAAAVAVAPVTNRVSQRLICSHPDFVDLFLADRYDNPGGKYFQRSPIMHAHKARTPTLNICGARDRCTPPGEAMQFHHALLENGVRSALVTYPEEGHGVRNFPASIDYAARVVTWFRGHLQQEPVSGYSPNRCGVT